MLHFQCSYACSIPAERNQFDSSVKRIWWRTTFLLFTGLAQLVVAWAFYQKFILRMTAQCRGFEPRNRYLNSFFMNSIFELILIEWQDVVPASKNSVVEIQELHLQNLQNKSTSFIVLVNSSGLRHVSSQII